jgi:hypothetical protein
LLDKKYFMLETQKKRSLSICWNILLNFLFFFTGPIGCSDMMGNFHNESDSGGDSIFNTTANTINKPSINLSKTSAGFSGTWMGFKDSGTGTYSVVKLGSSLYGNGGFNEVGFGSLDSFSWVYWSGRGVTQIA